MPGPALDVVVLPVSKTHITTRHWVLPALFIFIVETPVFAQAEGGPSLPPGRTIEQDLLIRLKGQSIGQGTLESLDASEEFLRRVADRIIRMDYQKRYRMVLSDGSPAQADSPAAASSSPDGTTTRKRTLVGGGVFGGLVVVIIVMARHRRNRSRK